MLSEAADEKIIKNDLLIFFFFFELSKGVNPHVAVRKVTEEKFVWGGVVIKKSCFDMPTNSSAGTNN